MHRVELFSTNRHATPAGRGGRKLAHLGFRTDITWVLPRVVSTNGSPASRSRLVVNKSPFVSKTAWEVFESHTYRRRWSFRGRNYRNESGLGMVALSHFPSSGAERQLNWSSGQTLGAVVGKVSGSSLLD